MKRILPVLLACGMLLVGCNDKLPVEPPTVDPGPGGSSSGADKLVFTYFDNPNSSSNPIIGTMGPDGSDLRRILAPAYLFTEPRNGRIIFITRDNSGYGKIIASDLDGKNQAPIATYQGTTSVDSYAAVLSEDGAKAAYILTRRGQTSQDRDTSWLYVVSVDGTSKVLIDTAYSQSGCAFSPDGKYVAYFTGSWEDNPDNGALMIRDVEGKNPPVTLADHLSLGVDGSMVPVWGSNDRILFTDGLHVDDARIVEVSVTTKARRTLAAGAWPVFNRDRSKIAFIGGGMADIVIMNADGGNQRNLTNTLSTWELFPSWSSDGKKIVCAAFDGEPDDVPGRIRMIDVASETFIDKPFVSGTSGFTTVQRVYWTK